MLKDRMLCSFMGNIWPKFNRYAEIDGQVTGRSVCGILQLFLERLGILWADVSTHVAIVLIHLLVTVSTPLDTVKSLKLKMSCLIDEHCLCWVIQIFKCLMVLKHAVLRSRKVVMFVFFCLNLKPTGYVMHHQFNIQQLYVLPTLYLCVLYLSENKQRLVPLTA
jgi:hypothetical protein